MYKKKMLFVIILYTLFSILFGQYLWSQPREKYIFENYVLIVFDKENNIKAIYRSDNFLEGIKSTYSEIKESKYSIFMYAFNSSKEDVWIYNFRLNMAFRSTLDSLSNIPKRTLDIFSDQINFKKTFKIIVYLPFYGEIRDWNVNYVSEHQIQLCLPSIPCFIVIYGKDFYIHFFINAFQKNINISTKKNISTNIFVSEYEGKKLPSFSVNLEKIMYIISFSLIISIFIYYLVKKRLVKKKL